MFKPMPGETVIERAKLDKRIMIIPGACAGAGFLLIGSGLVFFNKYFELKENIFAILVLLSFTCMMAWITFLFQRRLNNTEIALTDRRLLVKIGEFPDISYKEMPVQYLSCSVRKSLGYFKTLSVTDKSGKDVFSGFIENPDSMAAKITETAGKARAGQEGTQGA